MRLLRLPTSTRQRVTPGKTLVFKFAIVLIVGMFIFSIIFTVYKVSRPRREDFLSQTGQSLINLHDQSMGGWRFKSAIQAPHYQTDRDVGAAGIGMSFLALAKKDPHNPQWIEAANHTADWLIAVSKQNQSGRYWPDYVDGSHSSTDIYTSFDDGSIGIGDFFWQLYEQTHRPIYRQVALQSLQWTFSQAEPYSKYGIPSYRWKWDVSDINSPYYMGMGEGAAGLTYAFATYYERLRSTDPQIAAECMKYIQGSLNYIKIVQKELANQTEYSSLIPETGVMGKAGDTTINSGYLSGTAGNAYMYLKLYQVFGDKQYLNQAETLLAWLDNTHSGPMITAGPDSYAWRLSLDPQAGSDNQYATGFEEGAAGIGWVYLQAYKETGQKQYLDVAEGGANWLLGTAMKDQDGSLRWREDEHPSNRLVHANLNNGAAGIGMFLHDMYAVSGNRTYQAGAQGALKWLTASAQHRGSRGQYLYWLDNGGDDSYSNDPSWHWGLAGIIEFAQRMNSGTLDIPGEEPAL